MFLLKSTSLVALRCMLQQFLTILSLAVKDGSLVRVIDVAMVRDGFVYHVRMIIAFVVIQRSVDYIYIASFV